MSPQRVATGVGLVALAGLVLSVGLPPLLPPAPVSEIEIVVPTEEPDEPALPPQPVPPARTDDDDAGDDAGDDDAGDDDAGDDDAGDDDEITGDGPDDSPDDGPDNDGGDDD